MNHFVVYICTFERNEQLLRLLGLLLTQIKQTTDDVSILVVDNNPGQALDSIIKELEEPRIARIYVELPGVCHARNAALDHARNTESIAIFLDDDEEVQPNWLEEMLLVHSEYPKAIICGPVRPILFENSVPDWAKSGALWARPEFPNKQLLKRPVGNGNLLLPRNLLETSFSYPLEFNESGGEDTYLTLKWIRSGGEIRFAAKAVAVEPVVQSRLGFEYVADLHARQAKTWAKVWLSLGLGKKRLLISLAKQVLLALLSVLSPSVRNCKRINRELELRFASINALASSIFRA